jgi:aspartyl-tRNA(Asn)/glutamyl-tRNA(Gln) amidotransferase subunit A
MISPFPKSSDLCALGVSTLARMIVNREISPVELTEAVLMRIDGLQPQLNAFITVCHDEALAAAKMAEDDLMSGNNRGALHGIPFSVKDLTLTKGVRTTMGSPLYKDFVPDNDAIPVARMKAAGGILIGKTTTPAFGHKPLTEGILFGRTNNPFDHALTCGGSSGGSAVAVATGQGPISLGTDGGGSVRIPAACCGVVGLKPTLGVIPNIHVPDLFGSNSVIGPMGRTVKDVTIAFEAIAGADKRDPYGQSPQQQQPFSIKGLRVGWLPKFGNKHVDLATMEAAEKATYSLEKMGATVKKTALDFAALETSFLVILQSALCARLDQAMHERHEDIDPSLALTVEAGRLHSAVDLQRANADRSSAFQAVQALFEEFDILMSPTLACPPLYAEQDPHGQVKINGQEAGLIRGAWYPYTFGFNLTGHPAIAIPTGVAGNGTIPMSVQIAGPWNSEQLLLSVAQLLEQS